MAEFTTAAGYQPDLVLLIGTGDGGEVPEMRKHWADARYLGYEALLHSAEEAAEHLATYHGAVVMNASQEEVTFYRRRGNRMASSLWPNPAGRNEEITVPAITLDKIREKHDLHGLRTILWIDVEGGEWNAMKGGPELMQQVDWINIELTPRGKGRPGWCDSGKVHRWLHDEGFDRKHIHRGRTEGEPHDAVYARRNQ